MTKRFLPTLRCLCPPILWPMVFLMVGCTDRLYQRTDYAFGTLVEISLYDAQEPETAASIVIAELNRMERLLSVRYPNSEVSKLNAAIAADKTPVELSAELAAILTEVKFHSLQTAASFNPAVGRLVELWGFHRDEVLSRLPDDRAIRTLVAAKPSMTDIAIENGQLICKNKAVLIDLGGYAKGLALDRAAEILTNRGVKNALINIGGNILALGQKGDRPWTVGIRDPRANRAFAILTLRDHEAIGTSGDYQRFTFIDGQRYHHIIDPTTGYPADKVIAATILVKHPTRAGTLSDIYSKPFFIAGLSRSAALAKILRIDNLLITTPDGKQHATDALKNRLTRITAPVDLLSISSGRKDRTISTDESCHVDGRSCE